MVVLRGVFCIVIVCVSLRTLLWHGSRLSNWVGILSQGLRVAPPEAPVTGYMVRLCEWETVRENMTEMKWHMFTCCITGRWQLFLSPSLGKVFTLLTCHRKVPTTALPINATKLDSYCWARYEICSSIFFPLHKCVVSNLRITLLEMIIWSVCFHTPAIFHLIY